MNNIKNDNYEDIINLEHPTSKNHPRMSMDSRAAQFAPFSALTGYEENVKETARLTDERIDIDDGLKELLNTKLVIIEENLYKDPLITLTYFIPDKKKDGGKYVSSEVHIKRIDKVEFKIITKENIIIDIDNIINISSRDITFNFEYEKDDVI